tara:strand:- start:280 stop:1014 length:735 start_codon:yes stop_codon:yes gene_type:complete
MQFSDTTNKQGIIQECESLTGIGDGRISGNTDNLAKFTRWINEAYFEITSLIIVSDGRWQFDDTNQTNQPVATTDLVADQRDYSVLSSLPLTTQDWLEVDRIEILNRGGIWTRLPSRDKRDVQGPIEEIYKVSAQPVFYDFEGTSIQFYPAPNYNSTGGIRIWFKRAPLLFASTDTTKKPGFASLFHRILPYSASISYLITKDMGRAKSLELKMEAMKARMQDHYNRRDKYEIPRLARLRRSYR